MSILNTSRKEGLMAEVALDLLGVNNKLTTLELKLELRRRYPNEEWNQKEISEYLDTVHGIGQNVINKLELDYTDNGSFRTYFLVKPSKGTKSPNMSKTTATPSVKIKSKRISMTKALDLMLNSKGHFFTATFTKKDGSERTINCQCPKDQDTKLGYVTVKETSKLRSGSRATKRINIQTLKSLSIGGQLYKIR